MIISTKTGFTCAHPHNMVIENDQRRDHPAAAGIANPVKYLLSASATVELNAQPHRSIAT